MKYLSLGLSYKMGINEQQDLVRQEHLLPCGLELNYCSEV